MELRPIEEFGRQVLADLGCNTLNVRHPMTRSHSDTIQLRRCSDLPAPNDVLSHLRSLHRLLNSREVAGLLGWDLTTLVRRIKTDQFPGLKDKGRWKFDPGRVSIWLEEHLYKPGQDKLPREP